MAKNTGYPGMGGGNMQQLMKQAQKMQQDVQRLQGEIGEREFSASAGGGAVTAVVYGRKELKSVVIDPDCMEPDEAAMVGDMIVAAVNEALRAADETMEKEMARVTGGMGLGF